MSVIDAIVGFDGALAQALNGVAARDNAFNHIAVIFGDNNFVKMAPFVWMLAWFWNKAPLERNRRVIGAGISGIFIAFFIGRVLQTMLPFRARPIHTESLGLSLAPGIVNEMLGGWSSFPSDHAAIFVALAGLAFFLSRRWGIAAALFAVVFVLGTRVYFGIHFLTDVLGGAAIGVVAALLAQSGPVMRWVGEPIERLSRRYPQWFYPVALLFVAQLIQMFADVRMYGSILKGVLRGTFH